MRKWAACFLSLLWIALGCLAGETQASWLLDPKRFHASVHGQTSCQDCHGDIRERGMHPDPSDMVKRREEFFHVDHCLACHDDVLEKLDQGTHGSKKVDAPEPYKACLTCHDPHYQLPVQDKTAKTPDSSKPRHEQCGLCHEERPALPPLSAEDEGCMSCHRTVGADGPKGVERIQGICFHCHGRSDTEAQVLTGGKVSPINSREYASTPHAGLQCTVCHPRATGFGHGEQESRPCLSCHARHDEKVAHDAHLQVACEACHLGGVEPFRDTRSGKVLWKRGTHLGSTSRVHQMMRRVDPADCGLCHRRENGVGAASLLLPPKSILCMPCHAATFSVGDTTTLLSLVVFLAGIVCFLSYVLTGTIQGRAEAGALGKFLFLVWDGIRNVFSRRFLPVCSALFLDVLLQRRLYRRSAARWVIHSLIFYPFVFRFFWGLVGLLGSLVTPDRTGIWVMLDKNHPLTGFLFDLTGVMLIAGILLAFLRGMRRESDRPSGLPGQDRTALGLLACIVLVGFVLEGMRIAMTGYPPGSGYSFLGYGLGMLLGGVSSGITEAYGIIWYVHAVLTGLFIAYLPFSRLLHIILAPVVLAMNAFGGKEH